jgi:TatD DNase family protein
MWPPSRLCKCTGKRYDAPNHCIRLEPEAVVFDSHCHPTDIEQPAVVVKDAVRAGVQSLLACGYNAASNAKVEALRNSVPALPIAIGLHPWFANEVWDGLQEQIVRSHAAAVGECGIDGTDDPTMPPLATQRAVFEAQLAMAREMGLPVSVHARKALGMVSEITMRFPGVRGILHAFAGSYEQAMAFVDHGWLIGVGGAVTRVRAARVRKLVQQLPLSCVVLETDAPAIGVEGIAPPNVRPAHLPLVAEAIAELRGISKREVSVVTNANADSLFGFPITRSLETD